jgi:uncharacterized protein
MTAIERRTLVGEVRAEGDGKVAVGSLVYNRLSQNLGGFVERVAPGAFAQTIKEQDVRGLFNHNEDYVLGRAGAGTLRFTDSADGLGYEIDLNPEDPDAVRVRAKLARGDVIGSSFGFRVLEDEWSETEQGFPLRTLRQVSLRDVGPVTFPAYTDSKSALRSLAEQRSLDIDELVAAAEANELRKFLSGDPGDDGRAPRTVVPARIAGLYC